MQVKKQQLELDMEQQTSSELGKEYVKAIYCHPAYLTYMQSTLCKMLSWMKHKLESRLPGEISINIRYADDTTIMAESEKELKSLLMRVKMETEKIGWKLNIQKTKTMASGPITSWEKDGETVEIASDFIFWGATSCEEVEKSWLIGKDSDAGRDWGQEEKGTTEDEKAGWHHWLDGREFEWTLGDSDGQGGLECCV